MKKLMAFAAALSLACPIAFAIPSTAAADTTGNGNSGNAALCQAGMAAYFGISQGNCVAYLNSGGNPSGYGGAPNANTFCHAYQSAEPGLFNAQFSSFGACVAYYNAYIVVH